MRFTCLSSGACCSMAGCSDDPTLHRTVPRLRAAAAARAPAARRGRRGRWRHRKHGGCIEIDPLSPRLTLHRRLLRFRRRHSQRRVRQPLAVGHRALNNCVRGAPPLIRALDSPSRRRHYALPALRDGDHPGLHRDPVAHLLPDRRQHRAPSSTSRHASPPASPDASFRGGAQRTAAGRGADGACFTIPSWAFEPPVAAIACEKAEDGATRRTSSRPRPRPAALRVPLHLDILCPEGELCVARFRARFHGACYPRSLPDLGECGAASGMAWIRCMISPFRPKAISPGG